MNYQMKKVVFAMLALFLSCSFVTNAVYADEEDTLDLNTEEVKNKKEDYSSLTDINGLNIFTIDMGSLLKEKEESKSLENIKTKEVLFTNDFQTKSEKKSSKNSLFNKIVVFDKTATNEKTSFSITPLLIIGTVLFSIVAFALTRKYYSRRESIQSEDNNYIY